MRRWLLASVGWQQQTASFSPFFGKLWRVQRYLSLLCAAVERASSSLLEPLSFPSQDAKGLFPLLIEQVVYKK